MSNFGPFWSGNVTGNKTGNFTLEPINPNKQKQEGILSFHDHKKGQQKYFLWWSINGSVLKFAGIKEENYQKDSRPILRGEAFLNVNNALHGTWYTNDGLKCCFVAYSHASKDDTPLSEIPGYTDKNCFPLTGFRLSEKGNAAYTKFRKKSLDKKEIAEACPDPSSRLRFTIWDR